MLEFPGWKIGLVLVICLYSLFLALPNFTGGGDAESFLPSRTVNLGLDLRGGSHLLLQIDTDHYMREQRENLSDDIRRALRKEKLTYSGLRLKSGSVNFTSSADSSTVRSAVGAIDPRLEIDSGDEDNSYTVEFSDAALSAIKQELLEQSIQIVTRRVDETGTREPVIQRQGDDRILLQVPGLDNPEELKRILGKTAKMTFHMVDMDTDALSGNVPPGTRLMPSDDSSEVYSDGSPLRYAIKTRVMLSGDLLTGASATYDQGQPVVSFKFNNKGARKFGKITQENVGKLFAIVLDGKVITAPRINSPILAGSGIITGNFTVESANELALLLRAGALPAPLEVIEERSVGPSLGADSIAAGKKAALLAMLLILVVMPIMYGRFGLFASVSLLMNMILILGGLSLLQATLTLPGIAGIVLTFGMAVDANVLIFERIREELAIGKTTRAAVEHGFQSAFGTIVDANITTLIAAVLLFYFGSGTVKGFAVTLSIGIISSMFSAILLTRMMVYLWMNKARPKTIRI
ncbi:MAG: protein translocase subunit SecD [Rickettsiales bacterium]|nr:protein translocase subunit SecD [Rickettsiales bacterium]